MAVRSMSPALSVFSLPRSARRYNYRHRVLILQSILYPLKKNCDFALKYNH